MQYLTVNILQHLQILLSSFSFFALDIPTQTLWALKARDNFRQSTYDKLQY